ncbi:MULTISPECIES: type I methionyl aminopeptidase [Rothia]|uniref:Methionine aminopeptidase n=1 Tax=Rothia kristinae TaxID=37923 RepID=A0A199NV52_9MICC|nr:type I methionyl aminopeptidase [Rothia kristinae]MDN5639666.1 type I methionyl aminopeptidase [Actinomycetes bacterium]TDP56592.1 methionine aminopeptidase type I [Kocuria sp. AG109]SIM23892.1 Methionine aminopeptidase Map [Mycobacteroides abscessus subsp. abscessus]MBG7586876.1 type I methionyl aminopeptidase [Rothia kristinae]MCA1170007.1 type I methionyl aminopeptidase [Rothia kristinae]
MFGRRRIEYKTDAQLRTMARAGVVTSRALDAAVAAAAPGVSTADLDAVFREVLAEHGATSNFLGYYDYPATICASPNEIVVHGIPGPRALGEADIISIDGGAIVEGWHGDSARTVLMPRAGSEDRELSEITREAMWHGIAAAASAQRVGEIGAAIEDFVRAESGGTYGIIEDYVGHGIGSAMHMAPDVPNYRTREAGPRIKPGMALAIEPMLVTGSTQTEVLEDDWTVVTLDGSHSSQWEHSVAFHRDGIWVLTAEDGGAEELARRGVRVAPIPQ